MAPPCRVRMGDDWGINSYNVVGILLISVMWKPDSDANQFKLVLIRILNFSLRNSIQLYVVLRKSIQTVLERKALYIFKSKYFLLSGSYSHVCEKFEMFVYEQSLTLKREMWKLNLYLSQYLLQYCSIKSYISVGTLFNAWLNKHVTSQ